MAYSIKLGFVKSTHLVDCITLAVYLGFCIECVTECSHRTLVIGRRDAGTLLYSIKSGFVKSTHLVDFITLARSSEKVDFDEGPRGREV